MINTSQHNYSIKEFANLTNSKLVKKNNKTTIVKIATISNADSNSIVVLHNPIYAKDLKSCKANTVILSEKFSHFASKNHNLLINENPYKAYALISQRMNASEKGAAFISKTANIGKNVLIGDGCIIKSGAFIHDNVKIGKHTTICENAVIGLESNIGNNCYIHNSVSISHTKMGNNVIVYPGARIGQDGFGFASDESGHYKIPHVGGVLIGDDVEIGANTCIDRGVLEDTIINEKCRIDNLVQIGHNVIIGKGCVIVAQTGICGSTVLGDFVTLAGQVGIVGHVKIDSNATILGKSMVTKNVPENARYFGIPAIAVREWNKQHMISKKK